MARDEITLHKLTPSNTDSVSSVKITKQTVTQANGIVINNAFEGKRNTLQIYIENTYATADSTLTIKAGNHYPNKCLGDDTEPLTKSAITVVSITDQSRFQNKDGSVNIDFSTNFTGNIWATCEKAAGPYQR